MGFLVWVSYGFLFWWALCGFVSFVGWVFILFGFLLVFVCFCGVLFSCGVFVVVWFSAFCGFFFVFLWLFGFWGFLFIRSFCMIWGVIGFVVYLFSFVWVFCLFWWVFAFFVSFLGFVCLGVFGFVFVGFWLCFFFGCFFFNSLICLVKENYILNQWLKVHEFRFTYFLLYLFSRTDMGKKLKVDSFVPDDFCAG